MTGTYSPIESYGLVGNLETAALVGPDGSVDWFPVPHVESPSAFAAILDADHGGHFRVGPVDSVDLDRQYLPRTNVLQTDFEAVDGTVRTTDFMVPVEAGIDGPARALYRKVECLDGEADVAVEFAPRLDYGRGETELRRSGAAIVATTDSGEGLTLAGDVAFDLSGGAATATLRLRAEEARWLVVTHGDEPVPDAAGCERALDETVDYWREWAHSHDGTAESDCVFAGPWHDAVVRSGLVLKLLTHPETGAVAAAPTTSLPEEIGGVRNWDYRYSWPRDAAFTVQALAHLGHLAEAGAYFEWFLDVCRDEPHDIRPLYGLHGEVDLAEHELDHLSGYRGSRPVRIGNAAAEQRQIDVYGELVLAVAAAVHHGWEIEAESWPALRDLVDYVVDVWDQPDSGIWEVRSEPRHFVHSKLMCWAALDRGVALAENGEWEAPLDRWRTARDRIHETILDRGFDDDRNTFTRSFESDAIDATALLVPVVGFLPFDDERVEGTVAAVRDELETEDGLVHRYNGADGLPGDEGTFTLCSFWLVDVLALSGQVAAAREQFQTLLSYASPLDLFAEEIDLAGEGGHHRGNFPQAFSHVGVVNSALYLGRMSDPETPGPEPLGMWLGDGPDIPG